MGLAYSAPKGKQSKYYNDYVEKEVPDLTGKTIAITGTTSGLGLAAAKAVASKGATTILLNRKSERAAEALEAVRAVAADAARVRDVPCDLSDFESVRVAAREVLEATAQTGLDVLSNNAGIMNFPDQATKDGFDVQIQTNHLSHFLLTSMLLPALQQAAERHGTARIVNHSSVMRISPREALEAKYFDKSSGALGGDGDNARMKRYQQSKLANAAFTYALQQKLAEGYPSIVPAVAQPGIAVSGLQQSSFLAGANGMALNFVARMGQTAEDGSLPLLHAMCGADVTHGSFVVPKHKGLVGTFVLSGEGIVGPPVHMKPDDVSTAQANIDLLWDVSEKAVGPFFPAHGSA